MTNNKLMKSGMNFSTFQKRLCQLLSATTTQISNELWSELSYIAKTKFKQMK